MLSPDPTPVTRHEINVYLYIHQTVYGGNRPAERFDAAATSGHTPLPIWVGSELPVAVIDDRGMSCALIGHAVHTASRPHRPAAGRRQHRNPQHHLLHVRLPL